ALILIAVGNLLLFFFGQSVSVQVHTRRFGGADDGRPINQRYEWSLDYTFKDKDGKTFSGHTTRRGSDISVKTDSRVYYFSFAPYMNALEKEAEPNMGQPLLIGTGLFLLFVMNKKNRRQTNYNAIKTPSGDIDVPELNDYDDSVEEEFHQDE
ncbi:MAG: hypothetical protein PHP29_07270, partial [Tissierellia bacterium]|nr:hypothetical protein [Tissierellia bacterium]